jgi:hypothetical protein
VAPLTKLVPDIVRVIAPTFTWAGEIPEICGTGFQSVTALELVTEVFLVSVTSIVTVFGVGRIAGAV